ncbi:MAG: DUF2585 family protein [Patescibacteria group bacterium]
MNLLSNELSKRKMAFAIAALFLITIGMLLWQGRVPFCECGSIKIWTAAVVSAENSQQLFDPYSFTHITHGVALFFLLWLFARKIPLRKRFVVAVALEALWEILENSAFVIERYRAATISLNYYGDSVFNTVGDIFAMMLGFYIVSKLSWRWSLGVVIVLELLLLYFIRDNLILNMVMLLHPIPAIQAWQAALSGL